MDIFKNLPRDLWSIIIIFASQMRIVEYMNKKKERMHHEGWYHFNRKIINFNINYFNEPEIFHILYNCPMDTPTNSKNIIKLTCDELNLDYSPDIQITGEERIYCNVLWFHIINKKIESIIMIDEEEDRFSQLRGIKIIGFYNLLKSELIFHKLIKYIFKNTPFDKVFIRHAMELNEEEEKYIYNFTGLRYINL
jgi:hypothetical protein